MSVPNFMTTDEAAVYLRYVDPVTGEPDRRNTWRFLERKGVKASSRRGRILLYKRVDIENTLDKVK